MTANLHPRVLASQADEAAIRGHATEIARVKATGSTGGPGRPEDGFRQVRPSPVSRGQIAALDDDLSDLAGLDLLARVIEQQDGLILQRIPDRYNAPGNSRLVIHAEEPN